MKRFGTYTLGIATDRKWTDEGAYIYTQGEFFTEIMT
jgi:hypothetical protein